MARILTKFGPKKSQRRKLFDEKNSNERDERKVPGKFEKLSKIYSKNSKKYRKIRKIIENYRKIDVADVINY